MARNWYWKIPTFVQKPWRRLGRAYEHAVAPDRETAKNMIAQHGYDINLIEPTNIPPDDWSPPGEEW